MADSPSQKNLAKDTTTESQFIRLFEAAECRTQAELADFLGIRQSSIAVAKRRGRLPSDWLIKILRMRGVNPDWILFGSAPKFLSASDIPPGADGAPGAFPLGRAFDDLIMRRVLGCFRARDLQRELVRRKLPGGGYRDR